MHEDIKSDDFLPFIMASVGILSSLAECVRVWSESPGEPVTEFILQRRPKGNLPTRRVIPLPRPNEIAPLNYHLSPMRNTTPLAIVPTPRRIPHLALCFFLHFLIANFSWGSSTAVLEESLLTLEDQQIAVHSGTLGPSLVTIAFPKGAWNGKLLLYNHGMRFLPRPLSSALPLRSKHYRRWLRDGWMVASSSFRRQGMIVREAIDDSTALYETIVDRFGEPRRTVLFGESMGATISLLMVESEPLKYHGAIAVSIGASRDSQYPLARSYKPESPLLFLCNSNETAPVLEYLHGASEAPVLPAFWWIDRVGHVKLSSEELIAALAGLEEWIEHGHIERFKNATIDPSPPASKARFADGGAHGHIVSIDPAYGNSTADFVKADFDRLNIAFGDPFEIRIKEKTYRSKLGQNYSEYETGDWFTMIDANGFTSIGVNYGAVDTTVQIDGSEPVSIFIKKIAASASAEED